MNWVVHVDLPLAATDDEDDARRQADRMIGQIEEAGWVVSNFSIERCEEES